MMEDRKRPLEADAASPSPAAKRRALSAGNGSPMPVPADGPVDLESFQKEAIFRQMKQYSREKERAEQTVVQLQKRKEATEAALAALELTWTELLNVIQERVRPVDGAPPASEGIVDLEELTSVEGLALALKSKLSQRARMTTALLERLIDQSSHPNADLQELNRQLREAKLQAQVKETELRIIRSRLQDSEVQLDKYKDALTSVERKLDRSQSLAVQAMERKTSAAKSEPAKGSPAKSESANDSLAKTEPTNDPSAMDVDEAIAKSTAKIEEPDLPIMPLTNGHVLHPENVSWEVRAVERAKQIERDAEERLQLQDEIRNLKNQLSYISIDQVKESRPYKEIYAEAEGYRERLEASLSAEAPLREKLEHIEQEQLDWKAKLEADVKQKEQDLENAVDKREMDLRRLRDARDDMKAELDRYKTRDGEKNRSVQELKTLDEALQKRLDVLQSEVKRLRTRLAANAGNEDLVDFLLECPDAFGREQATKSLLETQRQLKDVQEQLRRMEGGALSKDILAKSAKFDALFGNNSQLSPDMKHLADTLATKEAELESARIKLKENEAETNALFTEIDQLSNGFETLTKQNKSKVFELAAMEEKYSKLQVAKAQSDSKYFAQTGTVKQLQAERAAAARTHERQGKAIEKSTEVEKSLATQLALQNKEMYLQKQIVQKHVEKIRETEGQLKMAERKIKEDERRINDLIKEAQDRERYVEKKREEARKAEEEAAVSRKEAEQATARLTKVPTVDANATPQMKEYMKGLAEQALSVLRCSTCKKDFRTQLLSKCMHTFCKPCIDARISTRQRKCPACNLPFSQSDVQQIYFQ